MSEPTGSKTEVSEPTGSKTEVSEPTDSKHSPKLIFSNQTSNAVLIVMYHWHHLNRHGSLYRYFVQKSDDEFAVHEVKKSLCRNKSQQKAYRLLYSCIELL